MNIIIGHGHEYTINISTIIIIVPIVIYQQYNVSCLLTAITGICHPGVYPIHPQCVESLQRDQPYSPVQLLNKTILPSKTNNYRIILRINITLNILIDTH